MRKTLQVYFNQDLVGHLYYNQHGQLRFSYDATWMQRSNAMPLSQSLPLRNEPYTQKSCEAFFAGILPEAYHRQMIARIYGISPYNDFSFLEKLGGDCPGALSFFPPDQSPQSNAANYQFLSDNELETTLEKLPQTPLLAGKPNLRLSLAGAQNKIGVYKDADGKIAIPLDNSPSTHIIKPATPDFPYLVQNEALCLVLAKAVGIPTVEASMEQIGNIPYILIKRYDRLRENDSISRLHQEDFCQALTIRPELKYQNEGGPSLKQCFQLVQEASSKPAVDLKHFVKLCMLNQLIGNCDAHGKNFSLLYHPTETQNPHVQLAPAYDLIATTFYPELSRQTAMKMAGSYTIKMLNTQQLEKFAQELGLSSVNTKKTYQRLIRQCQEALEQANQSGHYPEALITALQRNCDNARKELVKAL